MNKKKWLVDASVKSGQIIENLKAGDYAYHFDALYSFLGGELPLTNPSKKLPFGLPTLVIVSLGENKKYKNGEYHFRSTLDGRRHKLSKPVLEQWLNCFKQVVIPSEMSAVVLDSEVNVFIDYADNIINDKLLDNNSLQGAAIPFKNIHCLDDFITLCESHNKKLFCLYGDDIKANDFHALSVLENVTIQSNRPLINALAGKICAKKEFDLTASEYELDQASLVEDCLCQTCVDHTRSYLHHLYQHTPILAVQLIAKHNVHYYISILK